MSLFYMEIKGLTYKLGSIWSPAIFLMSFLIAID